MVGKTLAPDEGTTTTFFCSLTVDNVERMATPHKANGLELFGE